MARRGRFATGGTGGSNLSQLVFDLVRTQLSRQVNSMVTAYMNQTDFRGQGVPSADETIAFLNGYLSNQWVSQADRDMVNQNIANIQAEESARVENSIVAKMNADPSDVGAVKEYIAFLTAKLNSASTPNLQSEAKAKLFKALSSLADALGKSYSGGVIKGAAFDAEADAVLQAYGKGSPEYQQLLITFKTAKYDAEFKIQNTLLKVAAAKGDSAYLSQLKAYKAWAQTSLQEMVDAGLATLDSKGNLVEGIDAAVDAAGRIADANKQAKDLAGAIAVRAATERYNTLQGKTSNFLKLVNQTLGSDYQTITQLMANQVDLQRFYAIAPMQTQNDGAFINQNALLEMVFGRGNSLMTNAKVSGNTGAYKNLVDLSKNYGSTSAIDDAAIIFSEWFNKVGSANGDGVLATKATDEAIADYEKMLERLGGTIPAQELMIHQRTLQAMKDARSGKQVDFTDISAFELANPAGQKYDPATGVVTTTFQTQLNLISNYAQTANDVADGKILSSYIGPDGNWHYGPAVDPNDPSSLTYMDPVSKRIVGVAPVKIIAPSKQNPTAFDNVGYYYDLGNGDFVIRVGNKTFNRNYDPFSAETITAKEFRNRYLQRVTAADPNGGFGAQDRSEFLVDANRADGASLATDGEASTEDALFSGVDKRIADIRSVTTNSPDAIDRIVAGELKAAYNASIGTQFESAIVNKYATDQQGKTYYGGTSISTSYSTTPTSSYISNGLSSYAFRNTPIANFFSTPAGIDFRAGERNMGAVPIAPVKPVTPTKTIGQAAGKPQTSPVAL